jgi:hypothetical protein
VEAAITRKQHHSIVFPSRNEEDETPVSLRAASHVSPDPIRSPLRQGTYLLDKRHEEFDDSLERILLQGISVRGQETEYIGESVINGVVFGRKLREKHFRQVCNPSIFILQTFGHFSELSFDFNLPGQYQEREGHQTSLLDRIISITEPSVEEICVFVNQSVEAHSLGQISKNSHRGSLPYLPTRSLRCYG